MSTMAPVPKDSPLMIAWEVYKTSHEYANSKKWAAHPEHLEGSLWAMFLAGWTAREAASAPETCECCTPERKCPDHGACVTDGEV